jgi:hypothetical protein
VTDNQKSHRGPLVRARAAVCAVAATALAAKTRSWLKQMETPPREFAPRQGESCCSGGGRWQAISLTHGDNDPVRLVAVKSAARSHHARHHSRVGHPDGVTRPCHRGPDACE